MTFGMWTFQLLLVTGSVRHKYLMLAASSYLFHSSCRKPSACSGKQKKERVAAIETDLLS
eukprot:3433041-Amphidinium_carterae.1